jgi:hypothetical protein
MQSKEMLAMICSAIRRPLSDVSRADNNKTSTFSQLHYLVSEVCTVLMDKESSHTSMLMQVANSVREFEPYMQAASRHRAVAQQLVTNINQRGLNRPRENDGLESINDDELWIKLQGAVEEVLGMIISLRQRLSAEQADTTDIVEARKMLNFQKLESYIQDPEARVTGSPKAVVRNSTKLSTRK